jgi:hypothetical protein
MSSMTRRFSLPRFASFSLLLFGSGAVEATSRPPNNLTAPGAVHHAWSSLSNITGLASVTTLYTKCEPGALASLTSYTDTVTVLSVSIAPSIYAGRHVMPTATPSSSRSDADVPSGLNTFASGLFLAIDITLEVVAIKKLVQEVRVEYRARSYWLAFLNALELLDRCDKTFEKITSFLSEIQTANAVDPQGSCPYRPQHADASLSACAPPQHGDAILTGSLVSPTVTPDQATGNLSFVLQKRPSSLP